MLTINNLEESYMTVLGALSLRKSHVRLPESQHFTWSGVLCCLGLDASAVYHGLTTSSEYLDVLIPIPLFDAVELPVTRQTSSYEATTVFKEVTLINGVVVRLVRHTRDVFDYLKGEHEDVFETISVGGYHDLSRYRTEAKLMQVLRKELLRREVVEVYKEMDVQSVAAAYHAANELVKSLNSKAKMCLSAGGAMVLLGLKNTTGDLDMSLDEVTYEKLDIVENEVFDHLNRRVAFKTHITSDGMKVDFHPTSDQKLNRDFIRVVVGEPLMQGCEPIHLEIMTIPDLIEERLELGRPKDIQAVELLRKCKVPKTIRMLMLGTVSKKYLHRIYVKKDMRC